MDGQKNTCGTCRYHKKDQNSGDWVCGNWKSDLYGVWTEYRDGCEEHERREQGAKE